MKKNTNTTVSPIDASTAEGRVNRLAAAKREHEAFKSWVASGKAGDKPATPNLDALNEEFAAGIRPKRKSAKAGVARQSSITEEQILLVLNEMRAKDPSLKSASKVVAEIRRRGLAIGYPGGAILKRLMSEGAPAPAAKPVTKAATKATAPKVAVDLTAARALAAKKAGRPAPKTIAKPKNGVATITGAVAKATAKKAPVKAGTGRSVKKSA